MDSLGIGKDEIGVDRIEAKCIHLEGSCVMLFQGWCQPWKADMIHTPIESNLLILGRRTN